MEGKIMRHVWAQGYAATGEHATAFYYGCCLAGSHIEACITLVEGIDKDDEGNIRIGATGLPSIWACALFDNEADARKSFG